MEYDLDTALAVSLIHSKPDGMDIVDYITGIQTKIVEKESKLFVEEFLCESEVINSPLDLDKQKTNENISLSFLDLQSFEKLYNNNMTPARDISLEREMTSSNNYCTGALVQNSSACLIQPLITMKTLSDITNVTIDSGYNTNGWWSNHLDTIQRPIDMMSQSVQTALNLFECTLFDSSELFDTVTNWDECSNLVRYFADYVSSMENNIEFGFTCRGSVILYIQSTVFKILDSQNLYSSIHVEYQCNLFVKFCYDKYIRWNTINLLINRLKIDVQINISMLSPSYLRSIYYTFHLIDKLLLSSDFTTTIKTTKNENCLTNLWKVNQTNKNENDTKLMKEMLKDWKISLEHITMETFRNNVFLVSIRANQCLNALKRITFD